MKFKIVGRSLRASFLTASIIPFLIGSAYAYDQGHIIPAGRFFMGLAGIIFAHLSANLFNDYYDHKNGADRLNAGNNPFSGGSRVIQDNLLPAEHVFFLAVSFGVLALIAGLALVLIVKSLILAGIIILSAFLAVEYTAPPLKLSYNRFGEICILFLFGILPVMSGFYIFSGKFTYNSLMVALPISFLITNIIVCNEIPDLEPDIMSGKNTLISVTGKKNGYYVYTVFILLYVTSVLYNILTDVFPVYAVFLLLFCIPSIKAAVILKNKFNDEKSLIFAGFLTILSHLCGGLGMIGVLVK